MVPSHCHLKIKIVVLYLYKASITEVSNFEPRRTRQEEGQWASGLIVVSYYHHLEIC